MKKLIISAKALIEALNTLQVAIPKHPSLPVLLNVFCRVAGNELKMRATDTELTICHRVQVESTDAFEFMLPFEFTKRALALVSDQPLMITLKGKKVTITDDAGSIDLSMPGKIEDFPNAPDSPVKNGMDVDHTLLEQLKIASSTTSDDELRPAFTKVLLELDVEGKKVVVASSDANFLLYSYSMPEMAPPEKAELLISHKAIKALAKLDKCRISWHAKLISFKTETTEIILTRGADDRYTEWRKIVPEPWPPNLTVNRAELKSALGRCCLVEDPLKETKLVLGEKEKVTFTAKDAARAITVSMAGDYTGEVKEVAFAADKLLKLMSQVNVDEIDLHIHPRKLANGQSVVGPILITSKLDTNYLALMMPMALQSNK